MKRILMFAGMALLIFCLCFTPVVAGNEPDPHLPFAVANVHFEQNATDGDFEVVFEAKGRKEGLSKLTVVSPDGRKVVDFAAPDASTLGIRQFRFESPEPANFASLRSAYPEGVYTFTASNAAGDKLRGECKLTHKLPHPTSFVRPTSGARGVAIKNLEITWTPVKGLAAYIIKIEHHRLDVSLEARVPGTVTKFIVPKGLLLPSTEYQLGIGTVTSEGNTSFVETTFITAGNKP